MRHDLVLSSSKRRDPVLPISRSWRSRRRWRHDGEIAVIQGLVNVDSLCRIKREHSIDQVVELLAKRIGGLDDCLKKKTGGGSAPASEFRHHFDDSHPVSSSA